MEMQCATQGAALHVIFRMPSSQSWYSGCGWSVFYPNGQEIKIDLLRNRRALVPSVKVECVIGSRGSIPIYKRLPLSLQSG